MLHQFYTLDTPTPLVAGYDLIRAANDNVHRITWIVIHRQIIERWGSNTVLGRWGPDKMRGHRIYNYIYNYIYNCYTRHTYYNTPHCFTTCYSYCNTDS